MSSGLRTFCHLCWHCTSVRFWQVRETDVSSHTNAMQGHKHVNSILEEAQINTKTTVFHVAVSLCLQSLLCMHALVHWCWYVCTGLLLTVSKFAMSFQSSDPWSSTSFFNFSSWKKEEKPVCPTNMCHCNEHYHKQSKATITVNVDRPDSEHKRFPGSWEVIHPEANSVYYVCCVQYFVLHSRCLTCSASCLCVYLFSCPACFAKVAFPCLGQWSIIIMFVHLGLLFILLTTVNTAENTEGARERGI